MLVLYVSFRVGTLSILRFGCPEMILFLSANVVREVFEDRVRLIFLKIRYSDKIIEMIESELTTKELKGFVKYS